MNEYLFKADLPEIRKDDVKFPPKSRILYMFGERNREKRRKEGKIPSAGASSAAHSSAQLVPERCGHDQDRG